TGAHNLSHTLGVTVSLSSGYQFKVQLLSTSNVQCGDTRSTNPTQPQSSQSQYTTDHTHP
ncbi:hypothetical protein M9458_019583, partial [Cirrhinus mrigala]